MYFCLSNFKRCHNYVANPKDRNLVKMKNYMTVYLSLFETACCIATLAVGYTSITWQQYGIVG